jgi:DUF971 family protein
LELGSALTLAWDDGRKQSLSAPFLRSQCPCESCKLQKPRPPASAYPGVVIERFEPVGRYALQLMFSDGHRHGAFSFDLLQSFPDQA